MSKLGGAVRKWIALFKEEKKVPIVRCVPESQLLCGKTALITGGSGGIGIEIARVFIDAGANVIITGTSEKKLEDCIHHFDAHDSLKSIRLNMKDVATFSNVVAEAAAMFAGGHIDILVNSAGVVAKDDFLEVTEEEYDNVMDINAKGTFFMCQAVIRHMIDHHVQGHILNLSSSSALRPAFSPYHISKWAVRGLTVGLADMFLSYGIVINAIGPGPTATAMLNKNKNDSIQHPTNPSGRYVMPEEVANLALVMVSGMGDMVVGDTFYITGGSGLTTLHD